MESSFFEITHFQHFSKKSFEIILEKSLFIRDTNTQILADAQVLNYSIEL